MFLNYGTHASKLANLRYVMNTRFVHSNDFRLASPAETDYWGRSNWTVSVHVEWKHPVSAKLMNWMRGRGKTNYTFVVWGVRKSSTGHKEH